MSNYKCELCGTINIDEGSNKGYTQGCDCHKGEITMSTPTPRDINITGLKHGAPNLRRIHLKCCKFCDYLSIKNSNWLCKKYNFIFGDMFDSSDVLSEFLCDDFSGFVGDFPIPGIEEELEKEKE